MGVLSKFVTRSHPSNPSQNALYVLGGGTESGTGIMISEATAMNIPVVFACVRVIAETLASLPLHVYQRLQPRGKKHAPNHPLYNLLHLQPNPQMTSMQWRETIAAHVALRGNSYSEIERTGSGSIKALWPLLPNRMTVKRAGGRLWYYYQLDDKEHVLADHEVLHIPGLGFDGVQGYSVVAKAREAMGVALATEKFGAGFFARGAKPSGVFTHPQSLGPKAAKNLDKSLKEQVGGLDNQNRVLILEEGMQWEQISLSQEDSQFLQTRKFTIAEIARMFRIPLHKLQEMDKATYSNIEHQSIEFVVDCIRPWCVRHEQAFATQLFFERNRKKYFAEHVIDGLLRGDIKSRYEAYKTGRYGGWLCANDIREWENQNDIPDKEGGNTYLVMQNMIPLDKIGEQPQQGGGDTFFGNASVREHRSKAQNIAKTFLPLFTDVAERIVNREVIPIRKAIEKHFDYRDLAQFQTWLEEYYSKMDPVVVKAITPLVRSYSDAVLGVLAGELEITAEIEASARVFGGALTDGFTKRHVGKSLSQLRKIIAETSPEDIAEALSIRLDEWVTGRPSKIAMNETVQMREATTLHVFRNAGITKKRWSASPGACAFCSSLSGTIVGIEEKFIERGETIRPTDESGNPITDDQGAPLEMMVRQSKLHPPIHRGCQCSIAIGD